MAHPTASGAASVAVVLLMVARLETTISSAKPVGTTSGPWTLSAATWATSSPHPSESRPRSSGRAIQAVTSDIVRGQ
jgi:hypothetical protein